MHVMAYAPYGAEGIIIRVEADIRRGIPGVDVTGLASGAVREARERVRAAFRNSGFRFPADRILVNLAPAGVRKEEAALDLPIALAVMAAAELVPSPEGLMVLGELELSGRLRPVRGVLAATAAGLKAGIRGFIVPAENGPEAAILAGDNYAAVGTLREAAEALAALAATGRFPRSGTSGQGSPRPHPAAAQFPAGDFREVKGLGRYKRALEIAAAGGHNVLVFGPPGAGKTMLARRLPSIMAGLTAEEAVETTRLHSLAGAVGGEAGLVSHPPFRSPHHSASAEGILGGGKTVRPGEISLAHLGVLFMDEAPEFRTDVLKSLREPLEDSVITISRAEGSLRLPADFQLVLAANPCPCGRLGIPAGADVGEGPGGAGCFCSGDEIARHWRRFGAALLDRVELRIPMGAAPPLGEPGAAEESSRAVAERVLAAVEVQRRRFAGTAVRRNARMPPLLMDRSCGLDDRGRAILRRAAEGLGLSGRARHGILRVARTLADLEGRETISASHVEEAVMYRRSGDDPYDVLAYSGIPSR